MKRNYSYLQGGNLPQKKLPKLDDQDIEKLYKFYTSKDKFHKKFQGTKRDYCSAVAGLIENFYQKQNLDKVSIGNASVVLKGGVKSLAQIRREKSESKGSEVESESKTPEALARREKEKEREIGKEYVEQFIKIHPDTTFSTKLNKKDKNVYTVGDFTQRKYLEKFSNQTRTRHDELNLDILIAHATKYELVIEKFFNKEIATGNFLLSAMYDKITDLTPEGFEQRKSLGGAYNDSNIRRKGKNKYDWSETDEASYRTEYLYSRYVLSKLPGFATMRDADGRLISGWTDEDYKFNSVKKLFSEEETYTVMDFVTDTSIYECKGNIIEGKDTKKAQVDTKKIAEIILSSFDNGRGGIRSNPKFGNVSFLRYVSNANINKIPLNEDGTLKEDSDYGLPIESIINLNINKVMKSEAGTKALGYLKKVIDAYVKTESPREKTDIASSLEVDKIVFNLIKKYFGATNKTDIGGLKMNLKPTEPQVSSLSLNLLNPRISEKLELFAINDKYNLGENKTVSGLVSFLNNPSNKRVISSFENLGSDKLITLDIPKPVITPIPIPEYEEFVNDEFLPILQEWNPTITKVGVGNFKEYLKNHLGYTSAVITRLGITKENLDDKLEEILGGKTTDEESGAEESKSGEQMTEEEEEAVAEAERLRKETEDQRLKTETEKEAKRKEDERLAATTASPIGQTPEQLATTLAITADDTELPLIHLMSNDQLAARFLPEQYATGDVGKIRTALKTLVGEAQGSKKRDDKLFEMLRKNPPKD